MPDFEKQTATDVCPLFANLSESQKETAKELLSARCRHYKKGEHLFNTGDRISEFGLVLSGIVSVWRTDFTGDNTMLAAAVSGDTFAESLCWLKTENSPVFAVAQEDCEVLWLSVDKIRDCRNDTAHALLCRFTNMLARRTLNMNDRIQALSRLTIRDKLTAFFAERMAISQSRTFSVPFNREELAAYLGTNRSALSRELSLMKKDGIIDFYKNTFRVL